MVEEIGERDKGLRVKKKGARNFNRGQKYLLENLTLVENSGMLLLFKTKKSLTR